MAKIYFPESLERPESSPRKARSVSYRMADLNESEDEAAEEEDEYYGSDADEVLDSDEYTEDGTLIAGNRDNALEFSQESLTRAQVLKRLLFCCLMLNLTFVMCC